jgi:hypothetical protein
MRKIARDIPPIPKTKTKTKNKTKTKTKIKTETETKKKIYNNINEKDIETNGMPYLRKSWTLLVANALF